jgi:L-ascorbate metabolism protein UlaG (beta-lactamase superfamily)
LVFTVKWLGHASFKMIVNGKIIYVDPYQGDYSDKADILLISHDHHDHCDLSKIELIRKEDTVIIGPLGCAEKIGGKVEVLEPGKKVTVDNILVEAVHAYNNKRFRSPGIPFHPKGSGLGFLITSGGKTIYFAGDTDFIPEMKGLDKVNLALIPVGGTFTMDVPEAVEAVLSINPEVVIPIHRLEADLQTFKKHVEDSSKVKVILLNPGENYEFK